MLYVFRFDFSISSLTVYSFLLFPHSVSFVLHVTFGAFLLFVIFYSFFYFLCSFIIQMFLNKCHVFRLVHHIHNFRLFWIMQLWIGLLRIACTFLTQHSSKQINWFLPSWQQVQSHYVIQATWTTIWWVWSPHWFPHPDVTFWWLPTHPFQVTKSIR